MAKVFQPKQMNKGKIKRNRFDLSFLDSNTTSFGVLKPNLLQEVIPGDSFKIDSSVRVRSQPVVFPVGTRLRYYQYYYYVRNRTLYKDWEDFITRVKTGLTPPWLKMNQSRALEMLKVGGLGDSLGLPVVVAGTTTAVRNVEFVPTYHWIGSRLMYGSPSDIPQSFVVGQIQSLSLSELINQTYTTPNTEAASFGALFNPLIYKNANIDDLQKSYVSVNTTDWTTGYGSQFTAQSKLAVFVADKPVGVLDITWSVEADGHVSFSLTDAQITLIKSSYRQLSSDMSGKDLSFLIFWTVSGGYANSFDLNGNGNNVQYFRRLIPSPTYVKEKGRLFFPATTKLSQVVNEVQGLNGTSAEDVFVGNDPDQPISALPFRAYEMIYNYYFRNDLNNPYILNGEVQYNQFIPTDAGGEDTNTYSLHKKNWEFDAYTSAVPSPQFGIAPLVGIEYNGTDTAKLNLSVEKDGVTSTEQITVGLNEDGDVENIVDYTSGVPSGNLRQLQDMIVSKIGISINTLRNVNSFQRYLENMIRKGSLRYRDQLQAHFGVSVDYPDIDVPQFIGGFSDDLIVSQVTNMAEGGAPLGDIAGQIDALIRSKNSVHCYCPEHGFIIGIGCVVPVPSYSQILPKVFQRAQPFDYFTPEFSKIGYVPILRREMMPLQSPEDLDGVFGYQKAWYEYMNNFDKIHGDFLTTLRDFKLTRVFKDAPQLNTDFTTIDSSQMNNIFAVDDSITDKYGSSEKFMLDVYHNIKAVRPIPKHGVPSLE